MAHLELVRTADEDVADAPVLPEHEAIAIMVSEGARVLVIGCGDGALLELLTRDRKARARGLERDPRLVRRCVRRGLSVVQGDAETDLDEIPSASFEYVILPDALRQMRNPQRVLNEAARIGERLIVSIRNSGHWRSRLRLFREGRICDWEGPPGRDSSIRDFAEFARSMRLTIERATPLSRGAPGAPFAKTLWRANWFAERAVFLLTT